MSEHSNELIQTISVLSFKKLKKQFKIYELKKILPGQSFEHGFFSIGGPAHGLPPLIGAGLSQVRILFWTPLPQRG